MIGGFFAQIGHWRGAFWLLAAVSLSLAGLTRRALPARARVVEPGDPVPWTALGLLALSALLVSVASIVTGPAAMAGLVVAAAAVAVAFVLRERSAPVRVLPEATYRGRSPLRWIYASIGVLTLVSTIETFVPLFGQRLGAMSPLVAGFLGASISWGWTVSSLLSSNIVSARAKRVVRVAGPLTIAVGLTAYGLLQTDAPGTWVMAGWFLTQFVAGCGIGMAMCHWMTAALQSADARTGTQVSAGVNTSQLIAAAFGSALAGLLVALGGPGTLGSARVLTYGYALIGLGAVAIAVREFTVARRFGRSAP